uniref:Astacin domain-containing protein n=1 Tax=Strongyloides stercoralis TaxID=6248 RepID=A0A0K0E4F0_STRER
MKTKYTLIFLIFLILLYTFSMAYLSQTSIIEEYNNKKSFRTASQYIYIGPNINKNERRTILSAFKQIERRTCLKFYILEFKPWQQPDMWSSNKSYGVIMKSNKFYGYIDKEIEKGSIKSTIYLSSRGLHHPNKNTSRGIIMDQILKYMGYKEEYLRPDALSYIKEIRPYPRKRVVQFSNEQLDWPYDPESVTMPFDSPKYMRPTIYCTGRSRKSFGAGQREGLLTIWDSVKINSMYCPSRIINVDKRRGPCAVARKNFSMSRFRHKEFITHT